MGVAIPLVVAAASSAFAPALSVGIAGVFGVAAGTLTNVLAGALLGAATSAMMGGNPLTGALFGGIGGGIGSFMGGGAGAAEGAAEGAATVASAADDAGLSMTTASLSPADAIPLEGGGVGPPPTTAYDAVRSSITQGSDNIMSTGIDANVFSEGLLPDGNQFAGGFLDNVDPFSLAEPKAPGFIESIMSNEMVGDVLTSGGKYLAQQGMLEDQAAAQGDELRKTAEFKNSLKYPGVSSEGQSSWMKNAISNVSGTRAEPLAQGYSGRYAGATSQATYQPTFQQGTLFERIS